MRSHDRKRRYPKGEVVVESSTDGSEIFTLFHSSNAPFSNFYPSKFTIDGVDFVNGEQYFHYAKAIKFNDSEIAREILACDSPLEQKKLGRRVQNYIDQEWEDVCLDVMKQASLAKYSQNESLRLELFNTVGTTLVEASPRDCKWGIGLGVNNPKAFDRQLWRGRNLLGIVLTEVRDELMAMPEHKKEADGARLENEAREKETNSSEQQKNAQKTAKH